MHTLTVYLQAMNDTSVGILMLSSAAATFGYYTVWTILLVSQTNFSMIPPGAKNILLPAFLRRVEPDSPVVSCQGVGCPYTSVHTCSGYLSHRRIPRLEGSL